MPVTVDAMPPMPGPRPSQYEQFMDGQIWMFTDEDVAELRCRDLRHVGERLAAYCNKTQGKAMYTTRHHEGRLYFVMGPRTCRVVWCEEPSMHGSVHCKGHNQDAEAQRQMRRH